MAQKIKLYDREYEIDSLSDSARAALASLQFSSNRLEELENMCALMQRARNSYIEGIKAEMLASKSGLVLNDD
jgi:hypothetical protein